MFSQCPHCGGELLEEDEHGATCNTESLGSPVRMIGRPQSFPVTQCSAYTAKHLYGQGNDAAKNKAWQGVMGTARTPYHVISSGFPIPGNLSAPTLLAYTAAMTLYKKAIIVSADNGIKPLVRGFLRRFEHRSEDVIFMTGACLQSAAFFAKKMGCRAIVIDSLRGELVRPQDASLVVDRLGLTLWTVVPPDLQQRRQQVAEELSVHADLCLISSATMDEYNQPTGLRVTVQQSVFGAPGVHEIPLDQKVEA